MFEPIICAVFFTSLPTDLEITKSAATDFFSLYRHAPAILLTLGRVVPPPPPPLSSEEEEDKEEEEDEDEEDEESLRNPAPGSSCTILLFSSCLRSPLSNMMRRSLSTMPYCLGGGKDAFLRFPAPGRYDTRSPATIDFFFNNANFKS